MDETTRVGYRYNAVDIHSHILPGCDDGAADLRESLAMLLAARKEGVRDVIATSHYGIENGYAPKADKIRKAFEQVKEAAEGSSGMQAAGIHLYLGEEVYCSEDAAERFRKGEALTLNGTRCALVEFLEYGATFESGELILERLEKLRKGAGIIPVLAHAERYRALQENRDYLKRIRDMGVLIQVNAFDLALNHNELTRETAQWLAQERMISFIGSDMHGMPPKREPKMRAGIDWLYQHTDEEYADGVVRKNAEKILGIRKYNPLDE